MADKYFTASGLANAGCSLRKESSSRGTRGVFQLGLKWKDRFPQHSLTEVHLNPSLFQCFTARYLGEQVMVECAFSYYLCRQNFALLFAHVQKLHLLSAQDMSHWASLSCSENSHLCRND